MSITESVSDPQTKFWRLRRCDLLDCLSDAEVRDLGRLCDVRVLERGAVIYDVGEPGGRVFLLESGALKLSRVSDDGREASVAVLGPGEIFGERALAGEAARTDRAAALDDAVVCDFAHQDFEDFLFAHPGLALRVTKLMGARLRGVEARLQDILFKDVRGRLAQSVARLAEKFGEDVPQGRRIGLRLTQTDLAQLIGSTRETTSTIFNELRREGLVERDGNYIIVRDPEALAAD